MKQFLFLALMAVLLSACAASTPELTPTPDPGPVCCAPQPSGGAVFVDQAELLVMESFPVQIMLSVSGNLPTPCHTLHADVAQPDADKRIQVSLWSEIDPAVMCTQVLQPFEESIRIPMEGAADGSYSVWLNGELVGEFSYPG
ncbi:MAG: hypothetical protein KIT46_00660 [Anaerolineales bacterium]|nr:hypothetical protein [Anaerolineales bacterium]MCW5854533.1 hypothetical protein [Anaerolineales bacterium]